MKRVKSELINYLNKMSNMTQYKAWKMPGIGERSGWVIEDENGNVVNKNPSKEELKGLKEGPYRHGSRKSRQGRYTYIF